MVLGELLTNSNLFYTYKSHTTSEMAKKKQFMYNFMREKKDTDLRQK